MTEQEIFEKLKDALDHQYLLTDWGETEVTTLEEYLKAIKYERNIEKDFDKTVQDEHNTYVEFVRYLNNKSIGDTTHIIEAVDDSTHVLFMGYKKVTKEIINNDLYLNFQVDKTNLKAEWQAGDNYAVWQTCGYSGDDYSGYLLFPTHTKDEYFCLYYIS